MMRRCWIMLLALLVPLAHAASPSPGPGAVHAFLDRSQVSLGDTVTLNIQSHDSIGTPDLSPLQKDFQVLGTSRSSSVQIINGKSTSTSQLGIALKPLHAGSLTIPSLEAGGAKTQPLTLHVAAAPSGGVGKVGDPVFMEAGVKSSSPYVGQQTVYTVRLFYLPGVDGSLGDPGVDGARLIQLDRDHRYLTERDGYTYKVIERSWALIPQRSGSIAVRGPEFQGQRLGPGNPNAWFNNPNALLNNPNALLNGRFGTPVHAVAPVARIDARAAPARAGKPWLPARNVKLKLTGLPQNGQASAGVPLTVTLAISASGQPADALPEPELPPIAGAEVYPDQTRDATDDSGEWLQGTRTRSFAIVPRRNGSLTIPAITLNWWDVQHGHAEQAALPAHALHISGAVANTSSPSTPPAATTVARRNVPAASASNASLAAPAAAAVWRIAALASIALWVLAIVAIATWWWLRRKRRVPPAIEERTHGKNPGDAHVSESTHTPSQFGEMPAAAPAKPDPRALQRRALDAARDSDMATCEHALLAWARASHAHIRNTGALRDALADPAQRDALAALQRARWQGGDAASACAAIAQAFARGFAWRDDGKPARGREPDLPPLYPSS
jgi:hypothetical protein